MLCIKLSVKSITTLILCCWFAFGIIDTATGNEIERYALTYDSNATYLDEESVESTKIELSKGDIFKYSFTFKKQNFYESNK